MFFDKNWKVGKVLDVIVLAGKLPNNNHKAHADVILF